MSNDLNQWSGIGRLGQDPETRYSASGDAITSFSIACGWKSKDKEGTEWVNVTAFGKLAEICGEYLTKGKQVFIQGRLKTDKYEKDGVTRYSTKVVADRMQMLGSRDDGEQQPRTQRPQRSAPVPEETGGGFEDDRIPFSPLAKRRHW